MPELFEYDLEKHPDNPADALRELGTSEEIMDIVEDAIRKFSAKTTHPECDGFQVYCAAEIIRRHKPNVLFCHPGYVDNARHRTGLFSDKVNEAIEETDGWLKMLWDAVCDAGIEDITDFVVVSDHGHLNICYCVS